MGTKKGLTLTELIIVIGLLIIFLAIMVVVLNPGRQSVPSKNNARQNDVNAVLNSIEQYSVANNDTLPPQITTTSKNISNTAADLCPVLTPKYLPALPQDPSSDDGMPITDCTSYDTGYTVVMDASGQVTVTAPFAENGLIISAQR